jgi:uncharacterized protein YfkK (UPF0435 family)
VGHILVKEITSEDGKKEIRLIPLRENLAAKDIIEEIKKRKNILCIGICNISNFKDINIEEIKEKVNLCKEEDEKCIF